MHLSILLYGTTYRLLQITLIHSINIFQFRLSIQFFNMVILILKKTRENFLLIFDCPSIQNEIIFFKILSRYHNGKNLNKIFIKNDYRFNVNKITGLFLCFDNQSNLIRCHDENDCK